jgi:hypothetical protein
MSPLWYAAGALLCCGVLAQAPPAAGTTGTIAGIVRSTAGDALGRARVTARPDDGAAPHVAITGRDGAYRIDVPPGRYTVTALKSGFATTPFGVRQTEPPQTVPVAAGGRAAAIDISLPPEAVIAGRILDEDGTPLAGARVDALSARRRNNTRVLDEAATAQSDDRGNFRLFGLAAGEYHVAASDPAFDKISTGAGSIQYAPTYFPGTSFADEAKPVTVRAGETADGIEFAIRLRPPAAIRGRMITPDGRRLLSGSVVLAPVDANGAPAVQPGDISLGADGTFTIAGVRPGHYVVRARGLDRAGGPTLFAAYRVLVDGADVADVKLALGPGSLVTGTVAFERRHGTPVPTSLRVRAPFPDGSDFGDALTGQVDAHGAFAIRGVMDGDHQLVVEGLHRPWALRSITFHGHDITDEILQADEGVAFEDVRITIVDEAAEVSGRVTGEHDRAAADAGVLVFPAASDLWIRTDRRMRAARTDADGAFSIYGLPPGAYLAIAAPALDETDLGRPSRLEHLRAKSTPFTVALDARVTLNLRLADLLAGVSAHPDSR